MLLSCAEQMLGNRSIAEKLAIVRDAGFDGLDCRWQTVADDEDRRVIRDDGIRLGAMYSQLREPGLLSRTATERARALDMLEERAVLAAEAGFQRIISVPIFGAAKLRGFDPLVGLRETEVTVALTMLAEIAERLADVPITVTLEPLNGDETHLLTDPVEAAAWCAAIGSPRIGTMVDTYHCYRNSQDIPTTITAMGERLVLVHLSDSARQLPGAGSIDFAPLLAALRRRGYTGWLGFECRPDTVSAEGLRRSVRHLRALWEQAPAMAEEGGRA